MQRRRTTLFVIFTALMWFTDLPVRAQDAQPSLGDAARQSRLQKQKDAQGDKDFSAQPANATSNDVTGKDKIPAAGKDSANPLSTVSAKDAAKESQPKPRHVITNDEIPQHIGPTSTR